jgi:hypothetical protein
MTKTATRQRGDSMATTVRPRTAAAIDNLWVPESRPSAPSCDFAEEALTQMIGGWRYDCSI